MSPTVPNDSVLHEAQRNAGRKLGLLVHATVYLAVNGMLVLVAWSAGSGAWPVFPAAGWGIGLLVHALVVLGPFDAIRGRLVEREVRRIRGGRR